MTTNFVENVAQAIFEAAFPNGLFRELRQEVKQGYYQQAEAAIKATGHWLHQVVID